MNIIDIMAPAFFECLILVGIHSYLGLHVLRRKVIFVDLALAQIAALGTTVGFLFGVIPGSQGAHWFSFAFALIGAAVFSISRLRHEKIPQEAVIGLAYAIAASVAILVIDKAPHGAEHIKEILTGSILWVEWDSIIKAAIVYSIVGVFHYIFREKFILISEDPEKAYAQGLNVRFWDFLFYVSFGVVITHSVGTAGVLLVFVFLVAPAIASMLLTDVLWKQLLIGWVMGTIVSFAGLYISYVGDLPSGPTVVALYGITLVVISLTLYLYKAKSNSNALLKMAMGLGALMFFVFSLFILGQVFSNSEHHEHDNEYKIETSNNIVESNDNIQQMIIEFDKEEDGYTKIEIAEKIMKTNNKVGFELLYQLIASEDLPFVKEQAILIMRNYSNKNFGYDSSLDTEGNKIALSKWKEFINSLK